MLRCFFISLVLLLPSFSFSEEKVSFRRDVMSVFFKAGCNAGDCHGSARGQDGFILSLFGYDPDGDHFRLVEELPGRRIDLSQPEKSLLLTKAIGLVGHSGGDLFDAKSESYQIFLKWIQQGAKLDSSDTAVPTGITFQTPKLTLKNTDKPVQSKVTATYSDGSTRDVTRWTQYMASNEAVAGIGENGLITANKPGGAHVFARFDNFSVSMEVIVLNSNSSSWESHLSNNYIDDLVTNKLKEVNIQPSEISSDERFIRRVSLDITGQLPTPEEFKDFMANTSSNKREKLVDQLLERDSYADLWAAKWGEWLKIKGDTNYALGVSLKSTWNYYHWIRKQFQDNTPLDKFTQKLLASNGSMFHNPPSTFYKMIDNGNFDPQQIAEDTAQIFMGIRTQCAQCHNHPFDRWTMDDYYGYKSFFMGIRFKQGTDAREVISYVDLDADPSKHPVDERFMPAKFLGGKVADVKGKDPRRVLAQWLTSKDNKLFRENMANRIWAHFFGRGIIEPVDDIRISNPPSNSELYAEIGRRLAEDYQYDQKKLIRDICLSSTYQLSAKANSSNKSDEQFFSKAKLRRMRADVLFDSLNQAMGKTHNFRRTSVHKAVKLYQGSNDEFFKTFGTSTRKTVCDCENNTESTLAQSLHLMNGHGVNRNISDRSLALNKIMKETKSDQEVIERLYIRALSRLPSVEELSQITEVLEKSGSQKKEAVFRNLLWALVNSNEFIVNR